MDYSALHLQLNTFLQIADEEKRLIESTREYLIASGEGFVESFYQYINSFPPTAERLDEFRSKGGDSKALASKQLEHLQQMLYDDSTERLQIQTRLGEIHYQQGIEPVWVLSAYRLYVNHLNSIVLSHPGIGETDRRPLLDAVNKYIFRDIGIVLEGYWQAATRQLATEKSLAESLQQQITDLLTNIPQVLWSVDVASGRPIYISPSITQISPIEMELPIPCLAWTVTGDREAIESAWQQALDGHKVQVESRIYGPDNTLRWFRRTFHPFRNAGGQVERIDGIMEEITEHKSTLNRLETLATTDTLTGLPNRALYYDRLELALNHANRYNNQAVAVMLLDLNHFKYINDALGHQVGDIILRQVATRFRDVLRRGDSLARLGGDEFAVLLPNTSNAIATSTLVAEKIQGCFDTPYHYLDQELHLGVSIGIAYFPDHGDTPDELIRCADVAMYHSKRKHQPYQFYESAIEKHNTQRIRTSGLLRQALKEDRFELHYQPKLHLANPDKIGLEALIRLPIDGKPLLNPGDFIYIAEQVGLMDEITAWVLHRALRDACQWSLTGKPLSVSVNVSPSSFKHLHLYDMVCAALKNTGLPPAQLEVEITENALMSDFTQGSELLHRLSEMGVRISIDDFGTGYSSLAYLKQLPIDLIKIDKSFITDMRGSQKDSKIVRSVIDLGHTLGYQVVAEGVEDEQTLTTLRDFGCDMAQGFHISRPLPQAGCNDWLTRHHGFL